MIIVIDDERTFRVNQTLPGYNEIVYARNSSEGIAVLANAWADYMIRFGNMVDIYLDHDLGENDTIMPVVEFLMLMGETRFAEFVSNVFIHSQNPTAADTIIPVLSPFYRVRRVPLPELVS